MTNRELYHLITEMTLEEKVNQLIQVPGKLYQVDGAVTGSMDDCGYTQEQKWQAGSILGLSGAAVIRQIQKRCMEKQPHHIPALFMLDVIHGLRTVFPMPLGLGSSFDPELVEACAAAAAKEAAVSGVAVTFAPMADLVRDARWGRVMESTGEDPYLNCLLTAAMVRGFQGNCAGDPDRVAACVKHFAGYGAPEGGRDYNQAELSGHTLQEFYLPAYEAGIEAGSELVMTSFNTLNGIPASGSRWLMRKVLRERMGFEGVLISDYAAVKEMVAHGFCQDSRVAARKSVEAGVDIDMVSDCYSGHLAELVRSGEIEERLVDEAVLRVLHLKNKLGLFENPCKDANEARERDVLLCEAHRILARQAARESIVLLKNEAGADGKPVLPLNPDRKIAMIGPYADNRNLHSAWAICGRPEDTITVREAAGEWCSGKEIAFAAGCLMKSGVEHLVRGGEQEKAEEAEEAVQREADREKNQFLLSQALELAAKADCVVLFLGEHRLQSGEAASRADLTVPDHQMELFRKVCEVNSQVAVAVFSGRPLDLREISKRALAVLEVWLPGTEGGHAVMDVLTGAYAPSGKLPVSFPYCTGQVPVYYNHPATGRPCEGKGDSAFYRSRYLDIPNEPLYPFGYGLSYTTFSISPIKLGSHELSMGGEALKASVTVKNTGDTEGTETLQLYLRDCFASVVRPVKELKAFLRVTLKAGEERLVEFEITEKMLKFHTADGSLISEPGRFLVWIGNSSDTENEAGFDLVIR